MTSPRWRGFTPSRTITAADSLLRCRLESRPPAPAAPDAEAETRRRVSKRLGVARLRLAALAMPAALVLLAACASGPKPNDDRATWARFFLESGSDEGTAVTLPRSGSRLTVNSKPVITEGDILNVEIVQVELGRALMFQLTPSAARDFYRLSGTHQGRRLVLFVDGEPLGARRIDGAIGDGVVFVFVEIPEAAMPALVARLKRSAAAWQKALARKG